MAKKPAKRPRHRWLTLMGDWIEINTELENGDDRAKAIVAASYVENNLALAILARLRFMTEAEQRYIYDEEHAVFFDFASKIDLGWALNLYGEKVRDDLHKIRKVRNKFAHDLDVRTFDHKAVSRYCDELVGPNHIDLPRGKTKPRDRRERYVDLAAHFGERFAMDSSNFQRPPKSPNKIRADY